MNNENWKSVEYDTYPTYSSSSRGATSGAALVTALPATESATKSPVWTIVEIVLGIEVEDRARITV